MIPMEQLAWNLSNKQGRVSVVKRAKLLQAAVAHIGF